MPEQSPDQPRNVAPAEAVAVSVTDVFEDSDAVQLAVQSRARGSTWTVPVPAMTIARVRWTGAALPDVTPAGPHETAATADTATRTTASFAMPELPRCESGCSTLYAGIATTVRKGARLHALESDSKGRVL